MHSTFNTLIAATRDRELTRASRGGHMHRRPTRAQRIVLRLAVPADAPAVAQIAALDSKPQPDAPTLLAEVDGQLVAAAPVAGGRAVADPFEPTAHLVALLERHARTLRRAA